VNRLLGFISSLLLLSAGFSGQFGVSLPSTVAVTDTAVAAPRLLVPVKTDDAQPGDFDPTQIADEPTCLTADDTPAEVKFDPTKIDPQPTPQPKPDTNTSSVDSVSGYTATGPTVVMISRSWCGPCQRWKSGPMPAELRSKKWHLHIDEKAAAAAFPTFRVFDGKNWHTHVGPLTGADMRRMLGSPELFNKQASAAQVAPTAMRLPEYTIGNTPWSASSLRQHLYTHSNHRYPPGSLDGMSLAELRHLHNSDHHLGRSTTDFAVMRTSASVGASVSDFCPTCPQSARVATFMRSRR
jgi:hypothetical protein